MTRKRRPPRPPLPSAAPLPSWRWWPAALAAAVTLAAYLPGLSAAVAGGDSGELTAVAATGGVAHPPGYPLYTLLGRLFAALPLGTVAWRLNLMSAVCGALAAGLLFASAQRWTGTVWAGVAGAALFAFSPLVGRYATVAEVFSLNNLLCAALLALSIEHAHRPRRATLAAAALVAGLALANHHTAVFVILPLLAWAVWVHPRTPGRALDAAVAVGAGLLGLLPYLHLPLASAAGPAVGWGDQTTWSGFLTHLLRAEYGTFQLAVRHDEAPVEASTLSFLLGLGTKELLHAGVLLAAVGVVHLLRRGAPHRSLAMAWLAAAVGYLGVFSALSNLPLEEPVHRAVQERFYLQAHLIAALLAGCGAAALGALGESLGQGQRRRPPVAARYAPALLAVGIAAAAAVRGVPQLVPPPPPAVERLGRLLLDGAPQAALVVIEGDHLYGASRYLQYAAGVRPDVRVVDQWLLTYPWIGGWLRRHLPEVVIPPQGRYAADGYALRALVDGNLRSRAVLLVGQPRRWDRSLEGHYQRWPLGLAVQLRPHGDPPELAAWARSNDALFTAHEADFLDERGGAWEEVSRTQYWAARYNFALELLRNASPPRPPRPDLVRLSLAHLEEVARRRPRLDPGLFKTLGMAHQSLGNTQEMVAAFVRYLEVAPPDDPELPVVRQIVGR